MNILSIENARNELISFLENTSSRRLKAKRISEFFSLLIEQKSYSLIESYLLEFLPKYLDYLKTYSPIGINPEFTQSIIHINSKLIEVVELTEYKEKLSQINNDVEDKLFSLNKVLSGEQVGLSEERKAFFPLIEDEEGRSINQTIGAVDSITIKISRAKDKDKFIVVPSEHEKDKKLEEQIHVCWIKAKDYCKRHVKKLTDCHEVIISFDGNLGIYRGESLGAALTIAIIEEMLKYYNSQTVLVPVSNVAFTGGILESGKVNKVSKDIVEKKVEICFYSNCKILAVPKEDETFALNKLDELLKLHPKRNLRIVGVSNLEEILIRRDLVEIKKQKLIVRTAKFVKKNWVNAVVTVLLAVLFGYLFVVDWDDNPAILENEGFLLLVKNKNGKLLWTKVMKRGFTFDATIFEKRQFQKIVDIDGDGVNEVLLCDERLEEILYDSLHGRISCFNYKGKMLWSYIFRDTVSSLRERLNPFYSLTMVDTVTLAGVKQIICSSRNDISFSSAVFRISAKDGRRLDGTVWNAGHIIDGIIEDCNDDGKKELAITFFNNSYHKTGLAILDLGKLDGMLPCTDEYKLSNIKECATLSYILVPNTDFNQRLKLSMNTLSGGTLGKSEKDKAIEWPVFESLEKNIGINYRLNFNLIDFDIIIGSNFAAKRDNLVLRGELQYPLSDTKEYRELLKSQIIYWQNGKWVKRNEMD